MSVVVTFSTPRVGSVVSQSRHVSNLGARWRWDIKQGASFKMSGQLQLQSDSGSLSPIDITDAEIRCEIRKRSSDVDAAATCTVTAVDAANGEYEISLSNEQTSAIPAGEWLTDRASLYVADVLCRWTGGEYDGEVWEIASVDLRVLRQSTHSFSTPPNVYSPSLKFNDARNSQYMGCLN